MVIKSVYSVRTHTCVFSFTREQSGVVMCAHMHGNTLVYHSNAKTLAVPFFY